MAKALSINGGRHWTFVGEHSLSTIKGEGGNYH